MQSFAGLPRFVAGQFEVRDSLQKFGQCNPALQPRQRSAEAEVDAVPKSNVRVWIPGDVETICIAELLWVAVGRADDGEHDFSRRDRLAAHLDVARRHTKHPLQRRAVTEDFLDG